MYKNTKESVDHRHNRDDHSTAENEYVSNPSDGKKFYAELMQERWGRRKKLRKQRPLQFCPKCEKALYNKAGPDGIVHCPHCEQGNIRRGDFIKREGNKCENDVRTKKSRKSLSELDDITPLIVKNLPKLELILGTKFNLSTLKINRKGIDLTIFDINGNKWGMEVQIGEADLGHFIKNKDYWMNSGCVKFVWFAERFEPRILFQIKKNLKPLPRLIEFTPMDFPLDIDFNEQIITMKNIIKEYPESDYYIELDGLIRQKYPGIKVRFQHCLKITTGLGHEFVIHLGRKSIIYEPIKGRTYNQKEIEKRLNTLIAAYGFYTIAKKRKTKESNFVIDIPFPKVFEFLTTDGKKAMTKWILGIVDFILSNEQYWMQNSMID